MYQRIRDLREDRDLKQEDLARILNCTQACCSNYENGKRDIPTEALNHLADFTESAWTTSWAGPM